MRLEVKNKEKMTIKKGMQFFINIVSVILNLFQMSGVGLRLLTIMILVYSFSFSQIKQENIGTEVVNVVKPYAPTISDAFKVKETPLLNEEGNSKKEVVKYSIFPFPVASTFTPSKGKAEGVEKSKQEHFFKNYATFGVGNFGTINGELFVNHELNNTDYVSGIFRHHSSQGGIQSVELDDAFFDTSLDLRYGSNERDLSWNIDLGYQNQIYNWYGLPMDFGSTQSPNDRAMLVNSINPQQSYNTIKAEGKIEFNESIINDASLKFHHFSDAFGSAENRFNVNSLYKLDVMEQAVKIDLLVDYLGGSFKKNHWSTNLESIKYGFTNFGISPRFVILEDDWTLNLGVGLFYSLDAENRNSKFLVYPKISASYKVVGDLMIFYAGAEGNLEQNTYKDFADENPFVSPTLFIAPTDKQFEISAGLKGKLANNVSYNIKGSFINERNKALFKSNDYTEDDTNENYAFGNSFEVVNDDMKTVRFYGELKADFSKDVTFGISGTLNSYSTDIQKEAWNLPSIKLNSTIDFNITQKWYAGVNAFYVGERKDQQFNITSLSLPDPNFTNTLNSYFDINAHLGFKYSERLTAFLRANNITNKNYEKWLNYPVQGFQIVLGANYKFDF